MNYNQKHSNIDYGGRGMSLENDIERSNQFYLRNQRAVIHKKPTPIQVVHVDYPKRSQAVIKEAYFRTPSTTDYNGIYNGLYIDFEAKETKNKTHFLYKHTRTSSQTYGTSFIARCYCFFYYSF